MNPPSKRKISDLICLRYAIKDVPFFQQLIDEKGIDASKQFCKNVMYSFYKKGEILFNQGDIIDRFYVLLSGQVSVVVNHTEYTINSKGEQQQVVVIEEINTIESGYSVGDVALLRDQKRNVGIICKEDSHFLVLEKEDFNKIIADMELREVQNKINFMQSLQFFEPFSRRQMEISMLYFTKQKMSKGQLLCEENKISPYIYIIRKGEFRVTKQFQVERQEDPFSKKQLSYKDQIKEFKERQIIKTIEIATIGEGEICCEVDAMDDKPQFFTIECISQQAERVVSECYEIPAYKKSFVDEKLYWRSLRLQLIRKTMKGHSALLGGIYPKKNLINPHAAQEPLELVRRNSKQLDMYDKIQERKQIGLRNTQTQFAKRSRSGDDVLQQNKLQLKILPKVQIQSICDISSLPEIRSRNNSNQKNQLKSLQASIGASPKFTPQFQYQKPFQGGESPKIINLELQPKDSQESSYSFQQKSKQIKSNFCNQTSAEKQFLETNQAFQYKSITELKHQQDISENQSVNLSEQSLLILNKSIILQNANNNSTNGNIIQIYERCNSIYSNLNMKKKFNRANSLSEQRDKIFQNEKLQQVCSDSQNYLDSNKQQITITQESRNYEERDGKKKTKKILLSKKNSNSVQMDEYLFTQQQSCTTDTTAFNQMLSDNSIDNNQQTLDNNSSFICLESKSKNKDKLQNQNQSSKFINKFIHTSDGLAQCPKQIDSNYKELYKVNLIESFDKQFDNYQQYYQRHYFKPGSNFPHFNNSTSLNQSAKNYFRREKEKCHTQKQFDQMYSLVPRENALNDFKSYSKIDSLQNLNRNNTKNQFLTASQKCKTEENNPSKEFLESIAFTDKSVFEAIHEEDIQENQRLSVGINQISSPTNDMDSLEKVLKKKKEICREQERKIISHLSDYKIDEANLPVSHEENQAISDQLMRLLKTKFGKNQQKISTTDWRYNTSLNFTSDNDISNQDHNPKQQLQQVVRKRKSVIALKKRIMFYQNQSGGSSRSSSPLNSRRKSTPSHFLHNHSSQFSKEREIQQIIEQIQNLNKNKFISKIEQSKQLDNTFQSQFYCHGSINQSRDANNNKSSSCDIYNQSFSQYPNQDSKVFQTPNKSKERPTTTQKKQKIVIPLKTLNDWSKSEYPQVVEQSKEGKLLSDKENGENLLSKSDEEDYQCISSRNVSCSLPSKNSQSINQLPSKLSRKSFIKKDNSSIDQEQLKNISKSQALTTIYNNTTYVISSDQDNQTNQSIIYGKQFIPYISRKQNQLQQTFSSPSRPKRVVNMKVKYNPSPTKQKLNQTFYEQHSESPIKKQKNECYQKLYKGIPQLLIKQKELENKKQYQPLSQVEVWDSRMLTIPKDFNQTFYQYNTPLKDRKIHSIFNNQHNN